MEINDGIPNVGEPANRCCDGHLPSNVAPFREPFFRVDQAVRRATGRLGGGRRLRPVDYQVYTTGDPLSRDALAGEDDSPGKGLVLRARLVTGERSLAADVWSARSCSMISTSVGFLCLTSGCGFLVDQQLLNSLSNREMSSRTRAARRVGGRHGLPPGEGCGDQVVPVATQSCCGKLTSGPTCASSTAGHERTALRYLAGDTPVGSMIFM